MLFNTPHKRTLLFTAISTMSLLPLSGMTLAQDDAQIEEVVVTGSFIRRSEGFDQASSVLQFTAEDLENQGTLNLGEVIQQLSFVNGSASAITTMAAQGGSSRTTSIDLRGLGARSTLTLLDGKRLVSQNVNALIPTIALQRMDIVADGAAARYGSEAVAGEVNFVPYKSYDGLKLETFAEGDSEGDWDQHSAQLMWGGDVGGIDVVVAGQFRQPPFPASFSSFAAQVCATASCSPSLEDAGSLPGGLHAITPGSGSELLGFVSPLAAAGWRL